MKKREWNEGLNHIDCDLVEGFVQKSEQLEKRRRVRVQWRRFGAMAACLCLIAGAMLGRPLFFQKSAHPNTTVGRWGNIIPLIASGDHTNAPLYYGNYGAAGGNYSARESGVSVTAEFVEILPDTYAFFHDGRQTEYRLLKMRTVTVLMGKNLPEEFYYLVPVAFLTDFSRFDKFVIFGMAQYGYDGSIMYNKTKDAPERLDLILFAYRNYGYYLMGEKFMAFDGQGYFDARLWKANDKWKESTKYGMKVETIEEAEQLAREGVGGGQDDLFVKSLTVVTGEAAQVLRNIKSFENGLFVPHMSSGTLNLSPDIQFSATRYLNGYPTNESIRFQSSEGEGETTYTVSYSKANFKETDLKNLPDLRSAILSVFRAYEKGKILPPHIKDAELLDQIKQGDVLYEIFGWYAQTINGVVGVVRVTWNNAVERCSDDKYYIIERNSQFCRAVDRDDLLWLLGNYETTYIYTGPYCDKGKAIASHLV